MRLFSRVLALGLALMLALSFAAVADAAPSVTVFPVDRATILAGAVLDFKVEVNNVGASVDSFAVISII